MILGCAERGRKSDGPFNHKTGRGWVKAQRGHYFDALRKRSRVIPVIIETTGGISPHTRAHRSLARARAMSARVDDDALAVCVRAAERGRIPLQRLGTPEAIASAVAYLLSAEADYVTGAVLPVDGGLRLA